MLKPIIVFLERYRPWLNSYQRTAHIFSMSQASSRKSPSFTESSPTNSAHYSGLKPSSRQGKIRPFYPIITVQQLILMVVLKEKTAVIFKVGDVS